MRATARRAFVIGSWLVVASIVVQVFLAGLGIFTNVGFFWHANVNGAVVFFLPLLVVLVGWVGRVPRRTLWWTAALPGLVVVQSILLVPYHMHATGVLRAISSLHAANALLIFWVALQVLEQTRALGAKPQT